MRYLICADTHIDRKASNLFEIEQTNNFFNWFVKIGKEQNIKKCIHLGDFFHSRRTISVPATSASLEILKNISEWFSEGVYILKGNHDIYYKDAIKPSGLDFMVYLQQTFEKIGLSNPINIIEKPTKIGNCLLVPWIIYDVDLKNIIENNYDVDYILGHLSINEIVLNKTGIKSKNEKLNPKDFIKYKRVLSGHFHQYGEYGNIIYVGSPYHMDFNDTGKRGIHIFDDETNELVFVEYNDAPKYYTMDAEDISYDLIEGNNIKIVFFNNLGINTINEILRKVESKHPNLLTVSYKFSNSFTSENGCDNISDISGNKEILIDYIKKSKIPENINLNLMVKIIESLEKKEL